MEKHSYADMSKLQATNWWYAARRELLIRLVRQLPHPITKALDLGCGVGSNAQALAIPGCQTIGLDASQDALQLSRQTGLYTELIHSEAEIIPLPNDHVDLVLAADVLEHIDDVRALHEIHRLLRPDGSVILTVPAHRWLWNWNDDYSHHLRRYTARELRRCVEKAGFTITRIGSWNMFSVVPMYIVSLLQRLRPKPTHLENNLQNVPMRLNALLLHILRFENFFFLHAFLPIGVSLIVIAKKRSSTSSVPSSIPGLKNEKGP